MSRIPIRILAVASLILCVTCGAYGDSASDYWPTWRGPDASGVAPNGNPPTVWSETKNIKWKAKLPGKDGTSTPIIWDNKVFFQSAIETDKQGGAPISGEEPFHGGEAPTNIWHFDLVCLDRGTGETLWQKTVREAQPHEGHHPTHGFASYSPVTDGKLLWADFGSRGVHCFDLDGNHKWSYELENKETRAGFGEAGSPALAGDALIVLYDTEGDSFIIALDKNTGKQIWRSDRDERTTWSTPLVLDVNGRTEVVVNATNRVRSYDAKTGDLIWECAGQTANSVPTPVSGFGNVYCTSGFRGNILQAIELGHTGNLTGTKAIKWQVDERTTPYVPSPLLYGDNLYMYYGNNAQLSCYDAHTGEPRFLKQEFEGMDGVYASPVGVAGRVYLTSKEGVTAVIKASAELEILATNKLDDWFDASPAIAGDELFLKGKEYIYCISES